MSNKERPHILIIPEDDANRQMANGFLLGIAFEHQRQVKIVPICGGWRKVLDCFEKEYISYLSKYPLGSAILLMDFDGQANRIEVAKKAIPEELVDRVFVVGTWQNPEKIGMGSLESVGGALASDCRDQTNHVWGGEMFRHNVEEVARIRERVCNIMF